MLVRPYEPRDEIGWVRCRVLSLLDTAYFDDVLRTKPRYVRTAIELVAEMDGAIVGVIDVELDTEPNEVASDPERIGGAIWTIAVHPDHQRKGVGGALLAAAIDSSRTDGAEFLEAWTRDDAWVRAWYEQAGFVIADRYTHVYLDADDAAGAISAPRLLHIESVFAHYSGPADEVPIPASRTHECVRYVLEVDSSPRPATDIGAATTATPTARR
jgi:ribosomal protein S18 acetylase RimI-like enzyme